MKNHPHICAQIVLLLLSCRWLAAAPQIPPQYSVRVWQADEGLPHNNITAVAQAGDGYLWIGTPEGLARFDGLRFTRIQAEEMPPELNRNITALYQAKDGLLWIGAGEGGVFRWDQKSFSKATELSGEKVVSTFYESRDGVLWIGTSHGLARRRANELDWFTTSEGLADNAVRVICEDSESRLWVATSNVLHRFDLTSRRFMPEQGEWANVSARMLLHDASGQMWAGNTRGLFCWNGRWIPQPNEREIPFGPVLCATVDAEKNIWIGTSEGLARLWRQPFAAWTTEKGLSAGSVTAATEDGRGNIWLATAENGLNWISATDGRVRRITSENSELPNTLLSLFSRYDGSLWIGGGQGAGVFRGEKEVFVNYSPAFELSSASVSSIAEDKEGNLWLCADNALIHYKKGRARRFTAADGLPGKPHRLFRAASGQLWIGTDAGLVAWNDNGFSTFTTATGLSENAISGIFEDENSTLWIGTLGGGINRLKNGEFTSCRTRDGLLHDTVFEILGDAQGNLWMSSPAGVFRVGKKDLEDFFERKSNSVSCVAYGKKDGMSSPQCSGIGTPGAWRSADGRLWFATAQGVSVVDPNLLEKKSPPRVVIEDIVADRKRMENGEWKMENEKTRRHTSPFSIVHSPLLIPPGHGELEIHYTALSFAAPEKCVFKYKLSGVDSDWVEAGTRRAAYYNNLRPGKYDFQVIASGGDGMWNPLGANVKFTLQPRLWQTKWFLVLALLSAVAFVAGVARYITWRKVRDELFRLEHQHALERERARIAKDIHDDLGSILTRITLQTELAEADKDKPDALDSHLRKISTSAHKTVRSLDEIVWAVNPKNDTLTSLARYISHYANEFFENTSVRCRLEIPVDLPEETLSAEVRHNLFLVVKEALNNILKHANAAEVKIQISAGPPLEIAIADDGRGFDLGQAAQGERNGLHNMRKRIENLGGQFDIHSRPGGGTKLNLKLNQSRKA